MEHYHVTAVCSSLAVPPVIKKDQVGALIEYEKMINFVRDMTGLEITEYEEKEATFFDGSKVRVRKCNKDCLS